MPLFMMSKLNTAIASAGLAAKGCIVKSLICVGYGIEPLVLFWLASIVYDI